MQKKLEDVFGKNHGLDQKSVEYLAKALSKNNLPGFDYIEFKQSLAALAALNMDEATAYKSAFATASTMGLTKAKLLETATHYRNIIIKEKDHFENAVKKQIQQKVQGKQQEVERLRAQIEKHQEKIRQLEEQIQKFQATIDGADSQIQEAERKIQMTRDGFEVTHQSILNQIDKDLENIADYL